MTSPIPFDAFGGRGEIFHFAHANGFPPLTYRGLLAGLSANYQVLAMRQRPLWPGSQPEEATSVEVLIEDLIRFFDQEGLRGVVGGGHSLGAVVTLFAALRRPELFSSLVFVEPVFLAPSMLQMVNGPSPVMSIEDIPVVQKTRGRRSRWPSRQAVFDHFRVKQFFAGWSDEALNDYVEGGFRENAAGQVELIYSPAWETHIYTLMGLDVWKVIPKISHPTLGLRGPASDTLFEEAWVHWGDIQPQASLVEIPGSGHLLPIEKPEETKREILRFHASSGFSV